MNSNQADLAYIRSIPYLAKNMKVEPPKKKKLKHFLLVVRATVRMNMGVAAWRKQTQVRDMLAAQLKKQEEEAAIKDSEDMKLAEQSKARTDKIIEKSKAARAQLANWNPMNTPARHRSVSRDKVPNSAPGASSTQNVTHPRVETLKRKSRKSTSG